MLIKDMNMKIYSKAWLYSEVWYVAGYLCIDQYIFVKPWYRQTTCCAHFNQLLSIGFRTVPIRKPFLDSFMLLPGDTINSVVDNEGICNSVFLSFNKIIFWSGSYIHVPFSTFPLEVTLLKVPSDMNSYVSDSSIFVSRCPPIMIALKPHLWQRVVLMLSLGILIWAVNDFTLKRTKITNRAFLVFIF